MRIIPGGEDQMREVTIEIPYRLTWGEVEFEPYGEDRVVADLRWLAENITAFEDASALERVMRGATVLHKKFPDEPFSKCLHTAIVWEFG